MSNYTKITDFAAKDALAPGNPSKIVTGTAHDDEYNAIAVAVATKADSANASFTGTFTLGGVQLTATANELNTLDGITASLTELNYLTGVTSAIQTQLNLLAPKASPTFTGTVTGAAATWTGDILFGPSGIAKLTSNGDVVANRVGGTTGVIYFGAVAQGKYLYYDGSSFQLTGPMAMSGALSGVTTAVCSSTVTASDFIISSDARLKYDIRAIHDSGSIIDALSGYRFKFKGSDVARTGVIAQEVQQVLPELVSQREDGMLTISEGGLIAVLIEEVKSLRQRVATLEAR